MFTAAQIAAAVTATRGEFAELFLRAQKLANIPFGDRTQFNAVGTDADDRKSFQQAATLAIDNGWDEQLVDEMIESDRETGVLRQARATATASLQAMNNLIQGLQNPITASRGLDNASRWTGNVVIDHRPAGSGVLFAPHLFLTAWHVVKPLFTKSGGQYRLRANAAGRIKVAFDGVLGVGGTVRPSRQPQELGVHQDWCPLFVPCHAAELHHRLPPNLATLSGNWDFAVIRLAKPIGLERNYAKLNGQAPVPRAGGTIHVVQYPSGPVQWWHSNSIVAAANGQQSHIPSLRFLHSVNATTGSSGSPCFDMDFELFGMHQGVWANGPAGTGAGATNRGVPISRIWETLEKTQLPTLDPIEAPVWTLGSEHNEAAVIGCDTFLGELWAATLPGGNRVLHLTNTSSADDNNRGGGKTTRALVAEQVLSPVNHLKVVIDAPGAVKRPVEEFARLLCEKAGTTLPQHTALADVHSTPALWIKDHLLPAVVEGLAKARGTRLVWLILKNLDHCAVYGDGTSDLLYELYQQVLTVPWLRVILDGMSGNFAEALKPLTTYHIVPGSPNNPAVSREDILTYLQRRTVQLQLTVGPPDLTVQARRLHREYLLEWNDINQRAKATANLVRKVAETVSDYMATDGF